MAKNNEAHIFDDVFRTMEEHIPELMLPLINEVFKTNYPENTKVTRLADKRHLLQQMVETDSCLSVGNKLYHFECESNTNTGIIAIRMFQYDVTVALEGRRKEHGRFVVEFPASCVVYLRHTKKTKDKESVLVRMPDGQELEYSVPVIKSQKYEKEEIFKKKLYVLLPYYILRYEKQLLLIETEENRRQQFLEEYNDICDRLIETLGKENPLAYSELHKLMKRIQEYVLKKREKIRKGVQQVMGGHVLESWKEEMIRIGRTEGHAEGHAEALAEQMKKLEAKVQLKIEEGKSAAQIAQELVEDMKVILPIYEKLKNK